MKLRFLTSAVFLFSSVAAVSILAQSNNSAPAASVPNAAASAAPIADPVLLDWTPPALAELNRQAAAKSSFTLDRTMLKAISDNLSNMDEETRQAINKIDGVSVHLLRFGPAGIPSEETVDQVRSAYHLRGWKHMVSTSGRSGGSAYSDTTDLWLVVDGVKVRGAVILVETPKSLTLATVTGNLDPVDMLHLRGHFGIPRFEGDGFKEPKNRQ
jgi:hypothetical protein